MSELNEIGDKLYSDGCRDGRVEAITAILDLVDDDELEYVTHEIETYLKRMAKQKYDRFLKKKGWK